MDAQNLREYANANVSVKRGDRWWQQIFLPSGTDWSGSTFTPSSNLTAPYAVVVDDSQKTASPGYIMLSASADATAAHTKQAFQFDLAEIPIIGYTFLEGLIDIDERFHIDTPEIP